MLHHAHFYMKGGNRTFAALCIKVGCADKPACCTCGYCSRSILSQLRQFLRCDAACVVEAAVQSSNFGGFQTDLSPRHVRAHTSRTNWTCAGAANASAENLCMRSGSCSAAQQATQTGPSITSESAKFKSPVHCCRFQQSIRGRSHRSSIVR